MTPWRRRLLPRVATATALLVLLVSAAPAVAADVGLVGMDGSGKARFAWRAILSPQRVMLERGVSGSTLDDSQVVTFASRSAQNAEMAIAPDGTATFVWEAFSVAFGPVDVEARRSAADGSLGPVIPIAPLVGGIQQDTHVAVGTNGDAAFVWLRPGSNGGHAVVAARTLAANGALSDAQTLSGSAQDASAPQVAVAPNGDATFVWSRSDGTNKIVQTRTRRASTGTLTAAQNVSATGADASLPAVGLDGNGDATFAWGRSNGTNSVIQTRRRTAGGILDAVHDLSLPGFDAAAPHVAVDPGDDAVFTWNRFNGTKQVVQAAARQAGGTFSAAQTISAEDQHAINPHVGIDTAGNAYFAWNRDNGTNFIAQMRRRTAAGGFGSVLDLSATGASANVLRLAVAPGGDAAFAWDRAGAVQGRRFTVGSGLGPTLPISD